MQPLNVCVNQNFLVSAILKWHPGQQPISFNVLIIYSYLCLSNCQFFLKIIVHVIKLSVVMSNNLSLYTFVISVALSVIYIIHYTWKEVPYSVMFHKSNVIF